MEDRAAEVRRRDRARAQRPPLSAGHIEVEPDRAPPVLPHHADLAENSHQPFRRRERAMQRFRSTKTLQKFSSVHSQEGDDSVKILTLPWTAPSPYRKREIIQGAGDATTGARPMRANAHAILIEALGDAHRWLDELVSDPRHTLETLASREGKTERSIRMTVSHAFLAPDIVKAAVEGRLPRGYGLKRLIDLPLAWPNQWRTLGLETPARA